MICKKREYGKNKSKKIKNFIIFICIISLIVTMFSPYSANAGKVKKIKLSKSKVTLNVGKKKVVKVKGSYKKVKVKLNKAAKKKVKVTVKKKKITIKGKKVGNCKISVKGYNKKGKLVAKGKIKIIVKKAGTSNKTKTDDNNNTDNSNVGGKSSELEGEKPSSDTSSFDAGEYSIDKVHKGEATFYDRESTGAANLDDYESIYYTAAMNNEDYMNGLAGAYIEVTDKDGDVVNALITDRLPEGKKGDIDLSRSAFKSIEPEVTGRMDITWKIIPLPTDDPIGFLWKNTSSQYWAEVQVRNGRYPIKSVEYYDSSSKSYVALERKEYNYFAAPSGMGSGPYKFKITDFYGHIIIEDNIAINNNNEVVWGSKNFEY